MDVPKEGGNGKKDGGKGVVEEIRSDVMRFCLSEKEDGDVLCHAQMTVEEIQDAVSNRDNSPDGYLVRSCMILTEDDERRCIP